MTIQPKLLSLKPLGKMGYVQVNLSRQDELRQAHVHILVAEAFLKKPTTADRVCHRDDVGYNNHYKNLYWGDASSNGKDAYRNGRHTNKKMPKGGKVYNATPIRLGREVVELSRVEGFTQRDIVKITHLSIDTVRAAIHNTGRFRDVTWRL